MLVSKYGAQEFIIDVDSQDIIISKKRKHYDLPFVEEWLALDINKSTVEFNITDGEKLRNQLIFICDFIKK